MLSPQSYIISVVVFYILGRFARSRDFPSHLIEPKHFFPKFFFLSFISWWWRTSVCVFLFFLFGTPSERCSVFHLFQLFARTTMRKHELMILYTAIMGSVVCLWKFITIIFRICYSLDDKVKTATYNWRYEKKFMLFQTKWLLEYWVFGLIVWSVFLTIGASWVHRE